MDNSSIESSPHERDQNASSEKKRWSRWRHRDTVRDWLKQLPSWATSLVLHAAVVLLLAVNTLPLPVLPDLALEAAHTPVENLEFEEELLEVNLEVDEQTLDETIDVDLELDSQIELTADALETDDVTPLENVAELVDFGADVSELGIEPATAGMSTSGLEGRDAGNRANLLRRGGGTRSSEKAVERSLDWLARHQYPDGSWNFDHTRSECNDRCSHPGNKTEARAGATGLALLTYLGAGHTQEDGRYKRVVTRGILALGRLAKLDEKGASFLEKGGSMYSHGIATMAICEAYAMTGDPSLAGPAQAAINYVCYAQDPNGGGWRYRPRQAGDTSVMGWQIGALKSGYLSQLSVPLVVVQRASHFLDSVSTGDGAQYRYLAEEAKKPHPATTAIGHLCRMYIGIDRNDAGLKKGIEYLSGRGPSKGDSYYNYYTAQVLFHHTGGKGPIWKKWNEKMRDQLVDTQEREGHAAGSWTPTAKNHKTESGGRLYTTALSTMTLEVYYRMLPMYRSDAVAGDFEE